jgi:DNA-binding response OmpR family regulator
MRILLVENHETFARVVAGAFLRDHEVIIRTMVTDAQHEFDVGGFDVVMVDYDLADFKGSELIKYIRKSGYEIPIIGISARDEGNDLLLAAGASEICNKMNFDRIGEILAKLGLE